ncbi:hypothetical protein [Roseiconus nitratireducens]|uniref:hypothetical protein n=1 Tax=Roseiconus nitratireducens TaxID=2605748 RepID=UPI00191BE6E6|nr:hypothetical protein [Roseiconus nitratireducens]
MDTAHPASIANAVSEPGRLLDELERRQDDVLSRLDDLDAKLDEVLRGLEPDRGELIGE